MSNMYFYKRMAELNALRRHDASCGLRRERYLATCTCGYTPKNQPPQDKES